MTPTAYLLDNNVLSYFFNAGRKTDLAGIAKQVPLVVVDEVHQEALRHRQRGEEYRAWQAAGHLRVRQLEVGGVGSERLGQFYQRSDGRAWVSTRPSRSRSRIRAFSL
jgi:hypothetical protein